MASLNISWKLPCGTLIRRPKTTGTFLRLYVEQFDTLFAIEASIKADTAYYHQDRKLWELIGNVEVLNREGSSSLEIRYIGTSAGEVYSHEKTLIVPEDGQLIESEVRI